MHEQINEEQIIRALKNLSPVGRRKVLRKLILDLDELDRVIDRNQEKLLALCRKQGIDFSRLSDAEREDLIDQIIYEQ